MIVSTDVVLNTQQLKFIIDLMWATDEKITRQIATRHRIDDRDLECHLASCLGCALTDD